MNTASRCFVSFVFGVVTFFSRNILLRVCVCAICRYIVHAFRIQWKTKILQYTEHAVWSVFTCNTVIHKAQTYKEWTRKWERKIKKRNQIAENRYSNIFSNKHAQKVVKAEKKQVESFSSLHFRRIHKNTKWLYFSFMFDITLCHTYTSTHISLWMSFNMHWKSQANNNNI